MTHVELFEPFIGAPPPSTLDIDVFIASQRRAQRIRRVSATGAGVAVFAATLVGAALALAAGPAVTGPGGEPHPRSTTAGPDPRAADQAALNAEIIARLNPVVRQAVLAVRPDVTLLANNEIPGTGPLEFGHNRPAAAPPTVPETYHASADVRDADGLGLVEIAVGYTIPEPDRVYDGGWPTWPELSLDTTCPPSSYEPLSACTASIGPEGALIVAKTRYFVDGGLTETFRPGAVTEYEVNVTKVDGTQVQLRAANYDRTRPDRRPGRYDRSGPPYSLPQLAYIALERDIAFFG